MSQESPTLGHTRRSFLTAAGATAAFSLAGCLGDDDDGAITWVMNPAEEGVDIETQYKPLFEYLESEADVTIEGQPTADYNATVEELMRADESDRLFADTSPGAVIHAGDDIDVVGMRLAFGASQYFSLCVTTEDSGIDELADLEGEEVAFATQGSVSGFTVPMLMMEQAGLDTGGAGTPEDFDARPSDHFTARVELLEDDNIAAACTGAFSTAAHVPPEQFDEMSQDFVDLSVEYGNAGTRDPQLNLLGVSDPIPRAPIVVNAAWDEDIRYELEDLMIEAESERFEHDPEELADDLNIDFDVIQRAQEADDPEEVLDEDELSDWETFQDHELWFDGIEAADRSAYDPVQDILEELGLDPEDVS